jgi:hypothetical protein
MASKAQATKNRQIGLHEKILILYNKDANNKVKGQPTECKKICKSYVYNKELLSRIQQEFLKFNKKRKKM